ncbi:MAG: hypothetical protein SGI83_00245 [Bacteroidota bacterium]|nr:hypothetical protein [Bacteroidota bacterium]
MSAKQTIKIIITAVAILVAAAHIIFPGIKIDMITVALLAMCFIPWVEPLFKSVGLPGGIQFEFQDLKKIEADAKKAGLITTGNSNNESVTILPLYNFIEIAEQNKELALLSLRVEIEKKIREIATAHKIHTVQYSVLRLIGLLKKKNILTEAETIVLENMLQVLKKAANATEHDEREAKWVIEYGPSIINNLEKKIPV